jgi:hypothetical protein
LNEILIFLEGTLNIKLGSEPRHQLEDSLYKAYIRKISIGEINDKEEIQKLAVILDKIAKLRYDRWYS